MALALAAGIALGRVGREGANPAGTADVSAPQGAWGAVASPPPRHSLSLGGVVDWAGRALRDASRFEGGLALAHRVGNLDEASIKLLLERVWVEGADRPTNAQGGRPEACRILFHAWLEHAPAEAFAWMAQREDQVPRGELLGDAAAAWARLEPKAFLEALKEVPGDRLDTGHIAARAARACASNDPQTAIALALSIEFRYSRRPTLAAVLKTWAGHDPSGAKKAWANLAPGESAACAPALAAGLAHADPAAALAWSRTLAAAPRRAAATRAALEAWAEADPAAAVDGTVANRELTARERSKCLEAILGHLALTSPSTGAELIATRPELAFERSVEEFFTSWAIRSPDAAARGLRRLPPSPFKDGLTGDVAASIAYRDPAAARDWIGRAGDPLEEIGERALRQIDAGLTPEALRSLAHLWDTRRLQEGLEMLGTETEEGYSSAGVKLIQRAFADAAAEGAAGEVAAGLPPDLQDAYTVTIAHAWAAHEPEAALAWAGRLENESARHVATATVLNRWSEVDPAAVFEQLEQVGPTLGVVEGGWGLLRRWAAHDPNASMQWARGFPVPPNSPDSYLRPDTSPFDDPEPEETLDPVARSAARARFIAIEELIDADPVRAELEIDALEAGLIQDELYESLIRTRSAHDPAAAAEWAIQMPPGHPARASGILEAADDWTRHDPMAASRWLDRLQPGEERDAAVGALVANVASADPEGALAWAATVRDEVDRLELAKEALAPLWASDPATAREAAEAAGFSPDDLEPSPGE